jgi:hypothetical protein
LFCSLLNLTPLPSRHALIHEGRVRAKLLLHAGLRIESARIEMELEEEIAEENIQAEVRALSEKTNAGAPVNLDEELMRLLKGSGYALARRSLGIDSLPPDSPRHSVPSAESGTRFLHSSGFSDAPLQRMCLSRISIAILSLRASLRSAAAAAEEASSETASLPCSSSSWSVSSIGGADAVARDWVVDGNVAENVFRLKETLSSRMYLQSKSNSGDLPVAHGDGDLQGGFGVFKDLGSMIAGDVAREHGANGDAGASGNSGLDEVLGGIGDAFKGAFEKMSGGADAGLLHRSCCPPPPPFFPRCYFRSCRSSV